VFGRKKQDKCAICNHPIHSSWGLDDNDEMVEYKSHIDYNDHIDKQDVDSLLDQHHEPMTREELRAAQSRVRKLSPNHPSLSPKVEQDPGSTENLPDNVISLEQFRQRKLSE
jgi:hypothetical protein